MSVSIEHVTTEDLLARRESVLGRIGLTLDELAELAGRYMLTAEESEAWDEVRRIHFLLGE